MKWIRKKLSRLLKLREDLWRVNYPDGKKSLRMPYLEARSRARASGGTVDYAGEMELKQGVTGEPAGEPDEPGTWWWRSVTEADWQLVDVTLVPGAEDLLECEELGMDSIDDNWIGMWVLQKGCSERNSDNT